MPKVDIDYSNTIIYKIFCKDPLITDVYVGHTTNFVQRKYAHKQTCNNIKSPCYNLKLYKTIRSNGNWTNWNMVIVNFYNCKNQFEARQKEQEYFIEFKATLNSVEPLPQKNINMLPINLPPIPTIILPINPTTIKSTIQCKIPQSKFKYYCETCNYDTSKKCNFDSHLLSVKHNQSIVEKSTYHCKQCIKTYKDNSGLWRHNNKTHPENTTSCFQCSCGKEYKHRQGLFVHKKKCSKKKDTYISDKEIINLLIKENSDFKNMILEVVKLVQPTNNTINNKQFQSTNILE